MHHYNNNFPSCLTTEQKKALLWKIEEDYEQCETSAYELKQCFVRMAIKYYTRNEHSLKDILQKYRTHRRAHKIGFVHLLSRKLESNAFFATAA